MKTSRFILVALIGAALAGAGCSKSKKKTEITDLQRKQADLLMSEAQSATLFRNWAEAEERIAKAAELCPDTGHFWVSLGAVRKKLGKNDAAKSAYKSALSAFEDEAEKEKDKKLTDPWLQQVYVLALLGRVDDARARLEKIAKQFPNDPAVVQWVGMKRLDAMLADPKFKENAL